MWSALGFWLLLAPVIGVLAGAFIREGSRCDRHDFRVKKNPRC